MKTPVNRTVTCKTPCDAPASARDLPKVLSTNFREARYYIWNRGTDFAPNTHTKSSFLFGHMCKVFFGSSSVSQCTVELMRGDLGTKMAQKNIQLLAEGDNLAYD